MNDVKKTKKLHSININVFLVSLKSRSFIFVLILVDILFYKYDKLRPTTLILSDNRRKMKR